MKITGFGKKYGKEKINYNGNEKSEHLLFHNFYFQKKYKKNTTKAIRNTQIGSLTVIVRLSLLRKTILNPEY